MTNTETNADTSSPPRNSDGIAIASMIIKPFGGKLVAEAVTVSAPTTAVVPVIPVRPIPRRGLPKFRYNFKLFFTRFNQSWTPVVPEMNRADRRQYDREMRITNIRKLSTHNQRIVAALNSVAAGKTPLIAFLSCLLQSLTLEPVLAIDAKESTGTLNVYFDVEKQNTLLVRGAAQKRTRLNTWASVADVTSKHLLYGTRIIGSNVSADEANSVSLDEFKDMVANVKQGFMSVFLDGGNWDGHPFNRGTADRANQLLFPALAQKPDSFKGLAETMFSYYQMGFPAKVCRGLVVINASRKNESKEFFLDKIKQEVGKIKFSEARVEGGVTVKETLTVDHLGISLKNIYLIPYSEYIATHQYVLLEPETIGYGTYDAMLEILEAILFENVTYDDALHSAVANQATFEPYTDTSN
jgi:hypothetical protein